MSDEFTELSIKGSAKRQRNLFLYIIVFVYMLVSVLMYFNIKYSNIKIVNDKIKITCLIIKCTLQSNL